MKRPILFSLEDCIKCNQTKELLTDQEEIDVITFPHDFNQWSEEEVQLAKIHNVFEDLQVTAPILFLDGKKMVGYLRIRKWIQDHR